MSEESTKPQCGSRAGEAAAEYDVALHVAGLFIILTASCLGAGFPVAAKKIPWLKVPPKVFFACKHFGTGVLIATAFVHVSEVNRDCGPSANRAKLLPTAFGNLMDPCLPDLFTEKYPPMPGVIMMASMFALFVIEMYLNAKTGGHSHGGPTGNVLDHHHNHHHQPTLQRSDTGSSERTLAYDTNSEDIELGDISKGGVSAKSDSLESSPYIDDDGNPVSAQTYKKMSANITLLEGGILFHSVFVGMTISITIDGFIILLIALVFHQAFEGLGLGSRIAAVPYPKRSIRPWLLVFAFGTTAPLGQAIGLFTRSTYDPQSAFGLIIVGVFNAISSGLLIYAALVDLLAEDFLSEEAQRVMRKKDRIAAFCWVLAGGTSLCRVCLPTETKLTLPTQLPGCPWSALLLSRGKRCGSYNRSHDSHEEKKKGRYDQTRLTHFGKGTCSAQSYSSKCEDITLHSRGRKGEGC
ncbi:Putative ZIP Zinc transporter [[Torrubiella] hemipterigena]|uniref:Putative ZIP Zinc transporter n=1 Tax=[Torrubiella] hemipterigena TaxID=1531966 RepID=A0A0A1STQ9_9HYPO|nr:Putative ZIP Zinc transporter [[Torrubiella] hemipterigena]